MERFRITLFLALSLLLGSCNSYLGNGVRVAWAKQLYNQGNYQEALLHFLTADELEKDEKSKERIKYNIGLVFSSLGETDVAIRQWEPILANETARSDEALYPDLLYNISLLYIQKGMYLEARQNLVESLKLRPDHEGSRLALEYALQRIAENKFQEEKNPEESLVEQNQSNHLQKEQILNYVARKATYRYGRDNTAPNTLENDW